MNRSRFIPLRAWLIACFCFGTLPGCGSSSDGAGGTSGDANAAGEQSTAGASGTGVAAGMGGDLALAGSGASGTPAGGGSSASPVGKYAIAATGRGTCAIDAAGAVRCWGIAPTWTVPNGEFVELHASTDAMCAIRADRTVTCFDPPDGASGVAAVAPKGKVGELALQRGALCGTDDTGAAFCNSSDSLPVPLTVPAGESFDRLSVGGYFACGIRTQVATILCWGYAGDEGCTAPIPVTGQLMAPAGEFTQISSGAFSSCAVQKDGTVSCWGAGDANDDPAEMCAGTQPNFGQSIPPAGAFSTVSVAQHHACAIKTDGTVACWGAGTTDECQTDGENCRQSRPPAGKFAQVTVGNYHSCAITAARKIQCWGYAGADANDARLTPPAEFQ